MQRAGENELDLADPLLDGVSLRLRLLCIRLEIVREVAVQVVPTSVMSVRKYN